MGMIFFNALIYIILKDISSNETQVRELLYNNTILTLFSIAIIAPISEELVFRKSLAPVIKNKWAFSFADALLFKGGMVCKLLLTTVFYVFCNFGKVAVAKDSVQLGHGFLEVLCIALG